MKRRRWIVGGVILVTVLTVAMVAAAGRGDDFEELRPYVTRETLSLNTNTGSNKVLRATLGHPPLPTMTRTLRVGGLRPEKLIAVLERVVRHRQGWDKPAIRFTPEPSFYSGKGKVMYGYGDYLRAVSVSNSRASGPKDFMVIETRTLSWLDLQLLKLRKWRRSMGIR